jgi:hypothetical protein
MLGFVVCRVHSLRKDHWTLRNLFSIENMDSVILVFQPDIVPKLPRSINLVRQIHKVETAAFLGVWIVVHCDLVTIFYVRAVFQKFLL